jgi:tripartite-type tricarboxylate transporter receptor subunit TctC
MMFGSISTALPLVRGNRLHAIALTGLVRVKDLPNVPTLDELGMKGFEVEASYMLVAPAKLAPEVLKRLASAVAEINHEPETAAFAERIYARVLSGGPEESRAFLRREMEKWQGVASATGLKID